MPTWFRDAIAAPSTEFDCESLGTRIRYRVWNADAVDLPALLFCHGYRAHSHWWDFIAPAFTDHYRVVALDFAGMGDSGWRTAYDIDAFAHDILAVIAHARLAPVSLVGHSFGGGRVLQVATSHPELLQRAIVLDSYVHFAGDVLEVKPQRGLGRPTPYPSREAILARYRLVPEQPALPYLRDYIATHSIHEVAGGWRWKFDTQLTSLPAKIDSGEALPFLRVPVDYVSGGESALVSQARAARIAAALPPHGKTQAIRLPNTHHHLMLDQPQLTIETLKRLLS